MLFGSKSFKDGQTRRIVVVGGGYAGTTASQKLAGALKNFPVEITMIERRDTFHHSIGSPRAIVEPGFEKQLFVPYDNVAKDLPNLKVKTNTSIQSVEATHLVTATSEVIPFDYLVLATGANNREIAKFPTKPKAASAKAVYQKIQENVKSAKSFVVVGGGAVGVEIAGELLTDFPNKPVTLIHAGKKLLETNNVSDKMRKWNPICRCVAE
ncbi:FAD/NAD(P)-binding domain-containing protein [Gonapodya prolifera JEL478]|uniref:FAD/NAD(P)-binding domain-containing protein n=1 Tax=Gonapodya prolifera (strain JEL478) TaxID=1344416 RepID=A0A139AZ59_GONPJ|nr:FAD/NAD(P)-binding domain-containing protein [Gonapodya prolifera JEL478]|eukprot:KXS21994.1 FAD/NAD(P)-binding domain-containing protein [Gonapodya prolifera JEL478]